MDIKKMAKDLRKREAIFEDNKVYPAWAANLLLDQIDQAVQAISEKEVTLTWRHKPTLREAVEDMLKSELVRIDQNTTLLSEVNVQAVREALERECDSRIARAGQDSGLQPATAGQNSVPGDLAKCKSGSSRAGEGG